MGYTQSWYLAEDPPTKETWNTLCAHVQKLVDNLPEGVVIARDGDEPLIINKDQIFFNGVGDDAYETFVLDYEREDYYNFCKTAQKPYDLLVCAVLAVARHLDPKWIRVSSDGQKEDWNSPCNWASNVLGFTVLIPAGV